MKKNQEKKKNLKQLNERYQQRITIVKQGQEALVRNDILNAVKYFNMYLKIISDVKDCEPKNLSPTHFDQKTELSEMLLISHLYWDLTKLYDVTPHLEPEYYRCLHKFMEFTIGFKYQVVNAEMLRKFISKGRCIHKRDFKEAYKKIYTGSNKCYIAGHLLGDSHPATVELRDFRDFLVEKNRFMFFLRSYYQIAPILVELAQKRPLLDSLLKALTYPLVIVSAKMAKLHRSFRTGSSKKRP